MERSIDFRDEQSLNKNDKDEVAEMSRFLTSILVRLEQAVNICCILAFDVLKVLIFRLDSLEHSWNIIDMSVTFSVLKFARSRLVSPEQP